ncbi:unnamed protein product [Adineta ricciae]|uniref:Uncharacterized protein n=1 Tax=Adineta ricciae TaxID=249248 RepID=A0A815MN81_ADIRI|nr:unnamed protein product [Adineta ricciae]CAF1533590.1 unnamed protein product [Adineta ricciae]
MDVSTWCRTRYSSSLQYSDTIVLFIHLIGPFLANLCSALFIICGSTRQRSKIRENNTCRTHIYKQLHEHKQLLIGPIILPFLSLPHVIILLSSECVNTNRYKWLLLFSYFISFTPSALIFVIFVLPSDLYKKSFEKS